MYRWPHGRVIRITCFIVLAAIIADIAWNGAYAQLGNYLNSAEASPSVRQLVLGVIFSVIGLGLLIGGFIAIGFNHRCVDFLVEVESEMTRVEWPTTSSLIRSTIVIAIAVAIMAGVLLLVDWLFTDLLTNWLPALGEYLKGH